MHMVEQYLGGTEWAVLSNEQKHELIFHALEAGVLTGVDVLREIEREEAARWVLFENGATVSSADVMATHAITLEITNCLSKHIPIYVEGRDNTEDPHNSIVIDPLDGTNNFHRGMVWGVSAAHMVDGEPVSGAIAVPHEGIYMAARKGCGITSDPLFERKRHGGVPVIGFDAEMASNMNPNVWGIGITRQQGCPVYGMAAVATGMYSGYVFKGAHIWDIAAGMLVVRESGGCAEFFPDISMNGSGVVVAAEDEDLLNVLFDNCMGVGLVR